MKIFWSAVGAVVVMIAVGIATSVWATYVAGSQAEAEEAIKRVINKEVRQEIEGVKLVAQGNLINSQKALEVAQKNAVAIEAQGIVSRQILQLLQAQTGANQ